MEKTNKIRMEKLYQDYLPIIKSIASKYKDEGVPFEDLVQEGFLGLLEAEKKFDASKGAKFSTYAFYWVKKRILDAVRKEKIQTLYSVELNEEILENLPVEKTHENNDLDISSFNKILSSLEQEILNLHFWEGKTLSQISKDLGISREKVRQIKQLLIRKIKINQNLTENLYAINNKNI